LIGKSPVDLQIGDLSPLRCNPLVPVHFPGDRPTKCTLAGGVSRAFNLVFNRARMVGAVSSLSIAGNHEAEISRRPAAVHCAAGTIMVQSEMLEAGDTLMAPQERLFRTGETAATLLIVDLWEAG
jgi:environmental stress-induced protein Ves